MFGARPVPTNTTSTVTVLMSPPLARSTALLAPSIRAAVARVLRWISTPSRARASDTVYAASRSSPGKKSGSDITMIVRTPRRAIICAASPPARPPPNTQKPLRQGRQIEAFLGMNESTLGQSRNIDLFWTRARGNHRLSKGQCDTGNIYSGGAKEASLAEEEIDAHLNEPGCRVRPADLRANSTDAIHGEREVDRYIRRRSAPEARRAAHVSIVPRRSDQRFRRYRRVVQRVSTEAVAFD